MVPRTISTKTKKEPSYLKKFRYILIFNKKKYQTFYRIGGNFNSRGKILLEQVLSIYWPSMRKKVAKFYHDRIWENFLSLANIDIYYFLGWIPIMHVGEHGYTRRRASHYFHRAVKQLLCRFHVPYCNFTFQENLVQHCNYYYYYKMCNTVIDLCTTFLVCIPMF